MSKGDSKYRYEPGELAKVRKNLGILSPEEAKKIADRLGGEVGYEKENPELEKRYEEIKKKRPSTYDKSHKQKMKIPQASQLNKGGIVPKKPGIQAPMSFRHRIKTDFLCTNPEYDLKTVSQALASFFSFFWDVKDYINPRIIKTGDILFYKSLENMVNAIQGLTNKKHKLAIQKIRRRPLFDQIFKTLKSWDLEKLSTELARLQGNPRKVSIRNIKNLIQMIYRPIIQLEQLEIEEHVAQALKRLKEFDLTALPPTGLEAQKVKKYYFVARDELFPILYRLKRRFYPILMKLVSDKYYSYNEFFEEKHPEILLFLDLTDEDVLEPQPIMDSFNLLKDKKEAEGYDEPSSLSEIPPFLPSLIYGRGVNSLETVFPESGFESIEKDTDLYAYFHGLLEFPKGAELLPPGDPLQTILILVLILENLFYGFRNIQFGNIKDEAGHPIRLNEELGKILSSWHFYADEIYSKEYLTHLQEYCGIIERKAEESETLAKSNAILLWIKKLYFLPHLSLSALRTAPPQRLKGVPPLYIIVQKLKSLLSQIVLEMDEKMGVLDHCQCIQNPKETYAFAIPNTVSRRLSSLLPPNLQTNRTLINFTLTIVHLLEELLNKPESPFYEKTTQRPYRTKPGNDGLPTHLVPEIDLDKIFKRNLQRHSGWLQEIQSSFIQDPVTGFNTSFGLEERIRRQIETFNLRKTDFSLILVELRGLPVIAESNSRRFEEICSRLKRFAEDLLPKGFMSILLDNLSFLFILPGAKAIETQSMADELILELAYKEGEDPIPAVVITIPFSPLWNVKKTMEIYRLGSKISKKYTPPVLVNFDLMKNDFTIRDDYSYVEPFDHSEA